MDKQTLDLIAANRNSHPELDTLVTEHQALDAKVAELTDKAFLSEEEDAELHRMKKEKLQLRDRIEEILHQRASA
jgi:uncharacterized protein YdcH (DUF465 family)